jgi:hypothetical protein
MENLIIGEEFFTNGKTTICFLHISSGFQIIGTSSIVDISKFDFEIGKKYAKEDAMSKLSELEAYKNSFSNSYTQKQLVSFGNYLLSKERTDNINSMGCHYSLGGVYHCDLENWKHFNNI